jgi:hypothetical protein
MRAMRKARENAQQDISLKFEDEIERNFRRFCADEDGAKLQGSAMTDALFFRPRDKAGEVWAVYPDRARAWLTRETPNAQ